MLRILNDESTYVSDVRPSPEVLRFAWDEAVRGFMVDLRRRGYSLLTLRDYQGDVERLRLAVPWSPSELDRRAVDAALDAWRAEGASPAILRRKRSALRSFLEFLGKGGGKKCGGAEIWARMTGLPAADRLMLGLVVAAGVRLPELCALEGRDLKPKAGLVRIRAGLRVVPMHPALRRLVEDVRHETMLVPFRPILPGHNGFPVNTRTMHARFRRAASRLGAPDLRPDELRRELAAHFVRLDAPAGLVSAFLARDRGRPLAPRRGAFADLSCLAERLAAYPLPQSAPSIALPSPDAFAAES